MAQTCGICRHPERQRIDGLLVEGVSYRDIAGRFPGTSRTALARHKDAHLPGFLLRARDAEDVVGASDLLADIRARERRADLLGQRAEAEGDLRVALQALREWRGLAELRAKLAGELDERTVVNIIASPEWVQVRTVLLEALSDFPAARVHVAAALSRLDTGP